MIKTSNIQPPIPVRDFDWVAWLDGQEESNISGFGATEEIAINNLWKGLEESRYMELLESLSREFECSYDNLDEVQKRLVLRRFEQIV